MERILVTGSRYWDDRDLLYATLDRAEEQLVTDTLRAMRGSMFQLLVTHGACPCGWCRKFPCECDAYATTVGADVMAHQWALLRGHLVDPYPADWEKEGRAAGPLRNAKMVSLNPRMCVAFWRRGVVGTKGCVDLAVAAGVTTLIVPAKDRHD